jgi:hypothetical protein
MKNSIHILLTCFVTGLAYSQNNIVISTTGDRTVENAHRMTSQPKILDTVFPTPTANFPLLSINYDPSFEVSRISPAKINFQQKLPQLYNGYARIGIGSILMPLAELYYNNGRNRKLNYGVHATHLSSFGKMRKVAPANFDRSAIKAFVSVMEKKYSWSLESSYKNQGLHFYGFPNEKANKDSIAQRFNTFDFGGGFRSHPKDTAGLKWKTNLYYRYFNDKKPKADSLKDWRAQEHYFSILTGAEYLWGTEVFAADLFLQHNGYTYGTAVNDTMNGIAGIARNNTTLSLRPSISTYSKNTKLKAKVGFDLTASFGPKSKVYLYPEAEVKYSLFNDILIPYVGVTGGLTQQTYKRLTDENEFVLSHVNLVNQSTLADGFVGIKGTLSKYIGFNAMVSYSHTKNKALFVNDTLYSAQNRFNVVYDTINSLKIEGALFFQMKEKFKVDLIGRYYSYNLKNNIFAWNLPQMQIILRGHYNLYDKFLLNVDVNLEGWRRAQVFTAGKNTIAENGQFGQKLGFLADANIGLEYRYNKRISMFLNFNNVAAQRYKRWYNYPVQGFQVMLGATFRF